MESLVRLRSKLKDKFGDNVQIAEEDGVLLLSGELTDWNDIVTAGCICTDKKRRRHVVNDIHLKGVPIPAMRVPTVYDNTLNGRSPDILIIGAGIVGCAIARELSRWEADILLLEKEHDVAMQASSRNDGMVHPGIELKKGQLKQFFNAKGNAMYAKVCKELGVEFKRTGQYLCFREKWIKNLLPIALFYWKKMGIPVRLVKKAELKIAEPYLNEEIDCALQFPSSGIVCPYGLTIAYAENAVDNGVQLSLDTAVLSMKTEKTGKDGGKEIISVETNRGVIYPKVVINAAGVFCEEIAKMAEDRFYSIHPRKGTNLILDKKAAYQVNTIASLLGTFSTKSHSKGGGLVSTIDGNLLVGPDAMETYCKEDYTTERKSIEQTVDKQKKASPLLNSNDAITWFSGIRAATYEEDFVIEKGRKTKNLVHAAGIQSPGLTAAPAIGVSVARMAVELLQTKKHIGKKENFNPIRKPIKRLAAFSDERRDLWIKENPDYGIIVCRCEEISKGEIKEALNRAVPCDTLDGIKRRVRPGMGRCQGGFCGPLVTKIISEEKGIPLSEVNKSSGDSNLFFGRTKGGEADDGRSL